nr:acyltransferase [Pseudomonas luteola]
MDRQYSLDVLRGGAAICVAYSHLILKLSADGYSDSLSNALFALTKTALDVGKSSVLILFALSGYFILHSLQRSKTKYERPVLSFVSQRFFRLYPLYWMSLVLGVMFPWDDPSRIFSADIIAINATMLQGFFLKENVLGLYWTLQIEICFYVMCIALFVLRIGSTPKQSFILLGALYSFTLVMAYFRYRFEIKLPVALPLMLSVCFLAAFWKCSSHGKNLEWKRYIVSSIVLFYLLLLPICLLSYSRDTGFHETWYRYYISYSVGFTVFLWATSVSGKTLQSLASLGGLGYIIFLTHPSIYAFAQYVGFHPSQVDIPASAYIILMLIVVVSISAIIKSTVSDPILKYGNKITERLARKRSGNIDSVLSGTGS